MVDFQQRDTRRGRDDDSADESASSTDSSEDRNEGDTEERDGDHERADDHHAHDVTDLGVAILTISSTRTLEEDAAGDAIGDAFKDAGHEVVTRQLIGDDYDNVQHTIGTLAGRNDVDVVVTTGGTGVTPDDVTVEAARPLFDKELPGFGELFRALSREEVGTRVVGTRATGGIVDGVPVFCLPGSENAATLGAEEIVVPEAGHLAGLAARD